MPWDERVTGNTTNFDEVITLIDSKPVKFRVEKVRLDASTNDLVREWPSLYKFHKTKFHEDLSELSSFTVSVRDEVIINRFSNNENHPGLHNLVIRFGLYSKKLSPTDQAFELTQETSFHFFDETKSPIKGKLLTNEVLRLFHFINREWPMNPLTVFDLMDNFHCDKSSLQDSMNFLEQAEKLKRSRTVVYRHNRGGGSTVSYYINPKMASSIENELEHNVVIYSKIDVSNHRYFKLNPTHSEIAGKFALVLMPFKEGEFPQEVFEIVFEPVVKKVLGINCVKVNSDKFKDFLENKIYSHIIKSELIITELSTENPNVIYELGLSFAFEKNIITTYFNKFAKTEHRLSFDYEHFDTIFYDDYNKLEKELKDALEAIKSSSGVSYHSPPS